MKNKPRIELPKTFMGISTEEAYKRIIEGNPIKPETQTRTATNVEGMIHIPTVDVYFAKQRTHLGKSWNEAHPLLAAEGARMPTIEEFRQTLRYFKNSQERELQALYEDITQVRTPWGANWLDAYFEKREDGLYILTGNKAKAEKLEACLMEDKTPGINPDQWISGKNATTQGLPKSDIAKGDLYYWHPRENRVALFVADSDWANLDCYGYPDGRCGYLGVFGVVDTGQNARQQGGKGIVEG